MNEFTFSIVGFDACIFKPNKCRFPKANTTVIAKHSSPTCGKLFGEGFMIRCRVFLKLCEKHSGNNGSFIEWLYKCTKLLLLELFFTLQ